MQPTASAPALPQITFKRQLIDICTVRAALDCDADHVWALVETGTLRAFNLATEIFQQKFLRIVVADVEFHQRSMNEGGRAQQLRPSEEFDVLFKRVFPMAPVARYGVVPKLKVATVARQLNVKSDTLYGIIRAGWLRLVPGDKIRRGPSGSPSIELENLRTFLRKRLEK